MERNNGMDWLTVMVERSGGQGKVTEVGFKAEKLLNGNRGIPGGVERKGNGHRLYRPRRRAAKGDAGSSGDAARFKGGRTLPGNSPAASLLDQRLPYPPPPPPPPPPLSAAIDDFYDHCCRCRCCASAIIQDRYLIPGVPFPRFVTISLRVARPRLSLPEMNLFFSG